MTVLVVGASGATGSKLVEQLVTKEYKVKVIVRSPEKLPESWKKNANIQNNFTYKSSTYRGHWIILYIAQWYYGIAFILEGYP